MEKYSHICRMGLMELEDTPFYINKDLGVFLVVKGSVKMSCVSGSQVLAEGEADIVNVGEPVKFKAQEKPCVLLYLNFERGFASGARVNLERTTFNCSMSNFYSATADREDIYSLVRMLRELYRDYCARVDEVTFSQKAKALLIFLTQNFNDVGNTLHSAFKIEVSRERFERIMDYMLDHLKEKISLQEIASQEYLSLPYLSREFTDRMENSYNKVLSYYRVISSIRDLLTTDRTITYIAEDNGFSSIRYYNKIFKEYMSCLPSDFRKNNKNKRANCSEIHLPPEEAICMVREPERKMGGSDERTIYADERLRCVISGEGKTAVIKIYGSGPSASISLRIGTAEEHESAVLQAGQAVDPCIAR